jgi:NAD(P)-dependent dehydrogenase (short-subunit alcohol dehydrogenase family)
MWTEKNIPDLAGCVAVVTGANGGLGLETARDLTGAGAMVVMAARNQDKAQAAAEDIRATHPAASLEIVELDLGSLASIRAASEQILGTHEKIDILINNAGLMATPEMQTADGFEMQFGVNHLGHWALTAQLLSALLRAEAARVVTVTSTAHHMGRAVDPENPHLRGTYSPWGAYGHSKLANYHFGLGLQRVFEESGVKAGSLIAHPGLSHTDLQTHTASHDDAASGAGFWVWMAAKTGMSANEGAHPQVRAATDPDAKGGEFYGPRWVNNGPAVRKPVLRRFRLQESIDTLWKVSERETGLALDVAVVKATLGT